MMHQFLLPHVAYLRQRGYAVTLACADVGGRLDLVRQALPGVTVHTVHLRRSPLWPGNLWGFWDLNHLIRREPFDMIWTNEPVMGALTRLAARHSGAKVLYLCHGFHFYRGGPWRNWLLFYPIEHWMSRFTDLLVTINHEDAALARKLRAKRTAYLPGIGLDTARLDGPRCHIREELGLQEENFLILSVGELNKNKDHRTALRAIAALEDAHIHYALCGKGPLEADLRKEAEALGIGDRMHFLGYRRDLAGIYAGADLLLHPSHREGLPMAVLEGKYCGLMLIASDIRGVRDLAGPGDILVQPGDVLGFAQAIRQKRANPGRVPWNGDAYCLENVQRKLEELLESL